MRVLDRATTPADQTMVQSHARSVAAMSPPTDALFTELDHVIQQTSLDVHFQPIVDVGCATIIGFEALTRAPANSALHSPLVLFDTAARAGRLVELERIVMRRIVERFAELQLPGKLFLNVTADTLLASESRTAVIASTLQALTLEPGRIVLELTETRPVFDPVALDSAVSALRGLGLLMALDDLGEGFSGLRRWVDLRPDFVKIDRHFVDGVGTDPLKQQFVRSILEMATSAGTAVIAEGLEQESDLRLMMGLGVRLCQGYLLARPSAMPRSSLRIDVEMLLQQRNPDAGGRVVDADVATVTAGRLAHEGPVARLDWRCDDVVAMFRGHPRLYALPVLDDDDRPIGLLRSLHVLHRGAERFFLDLHGRDSCGLLMDANPLVFDVGASLRTMSEAIANLDDRFMVDGFLVTREGRYVGVGRTSDLLKALSDLQVLTAQNVHPLTRLPGNLAIDRHLGRLLEQQVAFTLVMWSIPGLQDYTDAHGHAAGDDVIRMLAGLLVADAGAHGDFVGQVGTDELVCILSESDVGARLERLRDAFDMAFHGLTGPAGTPVPLLAGAALYVSPGAYASVRQLSAAMAKARGIANPDLPRTAG